ncbi:phosphoribosylamine--glycine ligase [Maritalea mediterranea]|uniref:Phosphoribosylamine--glycine ligase n=1 Tax=Maritalea mediterranea TaxID=2909667 RepID=A0ABS9E4H9_9HYPH|nr:phosphoribosylamine--glycine ligase [Maritalea mediterranea]MCF4097778.1 phosphoribosylamine--glycine ligase [Maritalea mediterranea]
MNILLLGSGGREHALAWAIARSERLGKLYIAPGNPGMADCGELVTLNVGAHDKVAAFCADKKIDLVVVGPEAPLVAGITDDLEQAGIKVFGPSKAAAQLEGSKHFTKLLCDEMNVPTAKYARFDDVDAAIDYVRAEGAPIVVKADGLAAGKGVIVAQTLREAEDAVFAIFDGAFGSAGASVVIEECLMGEEASLFAISDGKNYKLLPSAQDHKRAYDGDKGPNTGGMGAYSPAPVMTEEMIKRVDEEIIAPSIRGMAARGTPFKGVLFAGLMITKTGPKLIEYNVRFGDPECQVLMSLLQSDIVDLLEATVNGTLDQHTPQWRDATSLTVVMASNGYPGSYDKGTPINGLDAAEDDGVKIFHAGTALEEGQLVATGGRVLNVTAVADEIQTARDKAYAVIERVDWGNGFYRKDIAWRALERKSS